MGLAGQEAAGTQAAVGIVGAAGGAVADLDLLAGAGKQHGVVTHDVATANGGKPDGTGLARAGMALAGKHADFLQWLAQLGGNGLADGQGGAGRGVHLVFVVGLDHLDVGVCQHLRGQFDQADGDVDARAHVGGLHDGNVPGGRLQACLLVIRKPGGADHHLHAQPGADVQIAQRGFGAGEVDQHVGTLQRLFGLVGDGHAGGLAHEGAGIRVQRRASGSVQGSGQFHVGGGQHRLDQHAPHAAGGAGNGNLHDFSVSFGW